jgi:hypothetical protein
MVIHDTIGHKKYPPIFLLLLEIYCQMADVSTSRLRKATFAYLRSCSNLSAITLKDVRVHLEAKLNLSEGSLKDSKDSIRDIVADFHSIRSGDAAPAAVKAATVVLGFDSQQPRKKAKKSAADAASEDVAIADTVVSAAADREVGHIVSNKFKYSNAESDVVMKVTEEYMKTHGLDAKDVCVALRNVNEGGYRAPMQRLSLWKELHELLPARSTVSLYDHVQARLFKAAGPSVWTDKDVAQLKQFVEQHGTRWSYIGKLMGRFPDDCKKVFARRATERKLTGAFSLLEDRRLFVAVQKALELVPADFVDDGSQGRKRKLRPVGEIPDSNIPWEAVAVHMDHERRGLDYLRRWPRLRQHLLVQPLEADSTPSSSSSGVGAKQGAAGAGADPAVSGRRKRLHTDEDSLLADDVLMLEQLELVEPDDESDVNWSSIDRKCSFGHGKSRKCAAFGIRCVRARSHFCNCFIACFAGARWKSLVKMYCSHITGKETFPKCLEFLAKKFRALSTEHLNA